EALEVILQAWTQETVSYEGSYYSFHDVTALPKPVQHPHPPIWAAWAVMPASFTWAGHKGFHPMLIPFGYPNHAELQAKLALKRAQADYGLTYVICEVNFGGFPHTKVMASLERFAKDVMPHLQ